MAIVAHQPQGFYATFSSRRFTLSKRLQLKRCLTKHHMVGRTDWHCLLKWNICPRETCMNWIQYMQSCASASCKGFLVFSVGPPCIIGYTHKSLRISAFKGGAQNDESVTRTNGLKVPKTSVRLGESREAKSESPKVPDAPHSYASETNESLALSPAIHRLFKKWIAILRTKPSTQKEEEILGEPPPGDSQETLQETQSKKSEVLKLAWPHFLALDVTIRIPLLIFLPLYLAINVIYGIEVSKELTPLWVLGPVIVALYIKIIQKLCALYVFSFNHTIKVLKNTPAYSILAYRYVFHGKLKEDIRSLIFYPILSIKNTDYKELRRKKLKELEEGLVEKYLDFVESIWPYYCRTIRFLKRANLI